MWAILQNEVFVLAHSECYKNSICSPKAHTGPRRHCLLLDCPLMCLLVELSTIYSGVTPSRLRLIDDDAQLLALIRMESVAHGKYSFLLVAFTLPRRRL